MKVKSSNVHNVSTKQLGKEAYRHTSNQSMKVKCFNAHNVITKPLRKETFINM